MSENVKENVKATADKAIDKAKELKQEPNPYENLRYLSVDQIDNMILYVINSNKEAFDMYFNLIKAKEANRIGNKPTVTDKAKQSDG